MVLGIRSSSKEFILRVNINFHGKITRKYFPRTMDFPQTFLYEARFAKHRLVSFSKLKYNMGIEILSTLNFQKIVNISFRTLAC